MERKSATMPDIVVRGLDAQTIKRLKERAARHGRSLQAEVRLVLQQAAGMTLADVLAEAARMRRRFKSRPMVDSCELFREDRER